MNEHLKKFEDLGPAWQLSQSDYGGYPDSERWWIWLPEEYGGNGTVYMAETAELCIEKAWNGEINGTSRLRRS